jgi:hypothetical protein
VPLGSAALALAEVGSPTSGTGREKAASVIGSSSCDGRRTGDR